MNAVAAYRGLLSNRPLSLLLGGEFVSAIGDWLYMVAILIVIYEATADPVIVGLFGALRALPYVVLSIPAGLVADRVDRRLVLLVTDLVRGGCMLAMAWVVATDGPVAVLVALAILATCSSTFFYPAIGAYITNLVRDERELGPANSLWATLDNLGYIIGPAIGGLLVAVGGAAFAFIVNAATFLVIIAILVRLPPSTGPIHGRSAVAEDDVALDPAAASDAGTAAPGPWRSVPLRPLAGLLLVAAVLYAFDGGLGILTVVLAIDILGAGEAATGYLTAAVGVGGVIGGVAAGGLLLRRSLGPPLLAGALVAALALAVLSGAAIVAVAALGMALYSFGYFLVDVIVTTILQRILPDAARGRGIGLLMTVGTLGEVVGSLLLPVLVGTLGIAALGPAGVLLVVAVLVGRVLIGPASTRAPTPAEETLIRVARGPLFAGVDAPRLETALTRLRTIPVVAGQVIVRQGDPADHFYLVKRGTFEVTQAGDDGGERRLRTLGPDDIFGELGLLSGAPRSATVAATTDGTLLALDGPEFLDLVGGGGAIRGRLVGLYDSSISPVR
jgi:MFS family permease